MAELIDVVNSMFRNKSTWVNISDEDKSKYFFIINRYMSKKYTKQSSLVNLKTIDKAMALDLWYYFMLDKPYPTWFWSKSDKNDKPEIPEKDYKLLLRKLKIRENDLDYLIKNNFEFIKDELKYFKEIEKQ